MSGDDDKIIRVGDDLVIKVTPEEEAYRAKYLPDPTDPVKLCDDKFVCTACSSPLAQDVHKGKTLYSHRALDVLVCEPCFLFYGDGCFSTDEDGDDKYCRWCGQGGTLYLCSACNCAFCQKCVKQNLKPSAVAEVEKDDWKCYFCNPRPLFGCRAICWGAKELNKIGQEKERERLEKQKEKLQKMEEKKKEKQGAEKRSRRMSSGSEGEQPLKRKKSRRDSDSDDSSPEVMPKKRQRVSIDNGHMANGSSRNVRRRRKDSSSEESSTGKRKVTTRRSRNSDRKTKTVDSSSDEDSDERSRTKVKLKKKKPKDSSDESSDNDKKRAKRKSLKKKDDSSEEEHVSKKKAMKKKKDESESSDDERSGKKKHSLKKKKKKGSSSDESSDENSRKKSNKKKKFKKKDESSDEESDTDSRKGKKQYLKEDTMKGKSENDIVKKRIKLAILWLNNAVKDIAELGSLIALRSTKFGERKINTSNLKTYDDVIKIVSKLKQLISGIHANYEHIEKNLDVHLKPWKELTGLEKPMADKSVLEVSSRVVNSGDISEVAESNANESVLPSNTTANQSVTSNLQGKEQGNSEDVNLEWNTLSPDEDSDEEEQNATKALISKANETLERDHAGQGDTTTTSLLNNSKNTNSLESENETGLNKIDYSSKNETDNNPTEDPNIDSSNKQVTEKSNTDGDQKFSKEEDKSVVPESDDDTDMESSTKKEKSQSTLKDEKSQKETPSKRKTKENKDSSGKKKISKERKKERSKSGKSLSLNFNRTIDKSKVFSNDIRRSRSNQEAEVSSKELQDLKTVSRKPIKEKNLSPKSDKKSKGESTSDDTQGISNQLDSSCDSTQLDLLSNKLKEKWFGSSNEDMNLITSLGIDSSGDSDGGSDAKEDRGHGKVKKKIKESKEKSKHQLNESKSTHKVNTKDKPKQNAKRGSDSSDNEEIKGSKKLSKRLESKKKEETDSSDEDYHSRKKCQIEKVVKTSRNESKEESSCNSKGKDNEQMCNIQKDKKEKINPESDVRRTTTEKEKLENEKEGPMNRTKEANDKKCDIKNNVDKTKTNTEKQGNKLKNKEVDENNSSSDENLSKVKKGNEDKKQQHKKQRKSEANDSSSDDIKEKISKEKDVKSGSSKKEHEKNYSSHHSSKEKNEVNIKEKDDKGNESDIGEEKLEKGKVGKSEGSKKGTSNISNDKSDHSNNTTTVSVSRKEDEEVSDSEIQDSLCEQDSKNSQGEKLNIVALDSSEEEKGGKEIKSKDNNDEPEEISETKPKRRVKVLKMRSERNQERRKTHELLDSSGDEEEKPKQLSLINLSSDDEVVENEKKKSKNENIKERSKSRSPSPAMFSSAASSDSEIIPQKKRRKKAASDSDVDISEEEEKQTKKRKRVRVADSSDDSSASGGGKSKANKKSTQGESPGKGGRKNIKKIKTKDDLADATKEAAEEEKERRRRIEERQKLFNQMFELKETKVLDKLVLDFDPEEKKELLSVDKTLVSKMKPHQAKGVKFMWDSCFESLSQMKKKKGSGCILAHCMGLGKTFQVISLVHTILSSEETGIHTVMVVCPLSTVLNWYNEFGKWLQDVEGGDDIEVFHLTKCKQNPERARELRRWQHNGGVMIMGYEMFRNLTADTKKFKAKMKKDFQETLVDPGADLIVCDEGHMLKNEATALSKAMSKIRTLRRIVLTGTPMQNNLVEYHCMVQFVKPNLLGTRKEFLNRFVNPINNGQFVDSTEQDVKVMKRRAHVLHKMLEGLVQRFDYNVLTPFLPPKHEYVVNVCLSELQVKLYEHYLKNYSQQSEDKKGGSRLFQDWQALGRIWTHPRVLKLSSDKANWLREKKAMEESDSEGSLKDFIDDDSEAETTPEESDDISSIASIESNEGKKKKAVKHRVTRHTRATRSTTNTALLESSEEEKDVNDVEVVEKENAREWWSEFVEPHHLDDINHSPKLILLLAILRESELIEDKVLVFSQSLFSLDLIEYFLDKIDAATQEGRMDEALGCHQGTWSRGLDYFRLDGSTSSENRNIWTKNFNREDNPRARLFLISTRAGGLGINLTAANRVIIFDASWNPSHDVQSIFRVYRFGQKKPCYIYRFIAHGTMEEKVYDRQVAKQSMSNRVVDEQQVTRHFSHNDLNELYSFTPPSKKEDKPIPALPKDVLFAEILQQFPDLIEKYHEHDSLLENVIEEELNEEERKLAWEDFENDKKRATLPTTSAHFTYAAQMQNPNPQIQIEMMRQQLKSKFPTKTDQEINQILVYQVSQIMRQQQFAAAQQAAAQQAAAQAAAQQVAGQQPILPKPQQMQYWQHQQQQQQQQAIAEYKRLMMQQQQANIARMQLQHLQQQQQQQQRGRPQNPTQVLQNLLMNQPMKANQVPAKSSITITELPPDPPLK